MHNAITANCYHLPPPLPRNPPNPRHPPTLYPLPCTRGTPPRVSWPATVHRLRSPAFLSLTPPVNCRTRGTRRCANPWHTLQTHPSRAAYTPPTLYPRSPLPSSPPLEGEKQSNPAHPVSAAKHPTAEPAPAEPAPSTRAGCARFLLLTRRVNRTTLRSLPDLTTRTCGTRTVFPGLRPPTRSNATPRPRSPPPSTTSPPHPRNPHLHHQPVPAASFLSYPAEPAPARPRIAAKPPTHCRAPLHTTSPHLLTCDRPPAPTANHRLRSPPLCRR